MLVIDKNKDELPEAKTIVKKSGHKAGVHHILNLVFFNHQPVDLYLIQQFIMLTKYLILLFLVIAVRAAEEDVLELSDDNFTEELKRRENTLVMFYAPW